ncbi:cell wall hydrolase [Parerythrobacter jejuensis]|uniref:Cell wall hydrolase n=1 Tax=Parerythrobacter jejuensis TaxID=795812 RepID=A0A845AU58_9SPHN|nr:cell wall hydrolase [Parerythrobacter jejuensis]MXP32703.1 cell wall hydrolase [Parerythrobacter jejuensis]
MPATSTANRFAFQRKRRGLGKRSRALIALAAAIAVPAFAAPSDWRGFTLGAQPEAELVPDVTPMPFEQPGGSFPGSAFYYLEDAPELAYDFEAAIEGADDAGQYFNPIEVMTGDPAQAVEVRSAGPAAAAFRNGGSGIDKARALQCLATAVYYEAASESTGGQKAVAQVVLNRVAHPTYPRSVCGVVYQGSERRTGCQFSFTCDGSLARKPARSSWAKAMRVAREALSGDVYAPVGHATHYHTTWINPYWASSLDLIGTIGAHRFYRWRGSAGKPSAFRTIYIGGEPLPKPKRRLAAAEAEAASGAADPVALANAYEEARKKAEAAARAASAPTYTPEIEARGGDSLFTAEKLPGVGNVKPEYANAGQWKEQP